MEPDVRIGLRSVSFSSQPDEDIGFLFAGLQFAGVEVTEQSKVRLEWNLQFRKRARQWGEPIIGVMVFPFAPKRAAI